MFDDFYDILIELNNRARELLQDAQHLDEAIDASDGLRNVENIKRIMQRLCNGMSAIVEHVHPEKPLLSRLFRRTGKVTYTPNIAGAIEEFIRVHEQQLRSLGISDKMLEKIKAAIRQSAGPEGEPVQIDIDAIARNLRNIRELICHGAHITDQIVSSKEVLKGCVQGAMGAATIVIDITTVFTVPDVTGIIIYKTVKSTIVGGRMVYKAIRSIRTGLQKLGLKAPALEEPADPEAPPSADPETPGADDPSPPPTTPRAINYPRPSPADRKRFQLPKGPKKP